MFHDMRQKRKMMTIDQTIDILEKGEYGHLATYGENGYPYSVPLNYIYFNSMIYFHSAHKGHKIDNIIHHPAVAFTVVSCQRLISEKFDTEYDSIVVYGKATIIEDEQEKKDALLLLIKKYSSEFLEEGIAYIDRAAKGTTVIKMRIEQMTGKRGR